MAQLIPVDHDPFAAGPQLVPVEHDPFQKEQGPLSTLGREAGIAVERGGIGGLASLADIPANVVNLVTGGIAHAAGIQPHPTPAYAHIIADKIMDYAHVPTADTPGEKILQSAGAGASGGAIFGPMAALSGAMGGGGSQLAANNGVGPVGQMATGLAFGMAPTAAIAAGNGLRRMAADVIHPASDANVGRIFAAPLSKPGEVLDMLKRGPEEYVPGSVPTTAETALDNDLTASQGAFLRSNPKYAADLNTRNTAARNDYIDEIAKTPADLAAAEASRTATTQPLYEAAKTDLLDPKAIQPIFDRIDQKIAGVGAHSDAGQRLLALKDKIQQSMPQMIENKSPILDAEGNPISTPKFENAQQGPLVQIYKEQRDAANKTGMQEGAYGSAVKGVVKPVIRELGDALEGQSPNLKAANTKFRDMSAPIDQMEALQGIKERVFKGGINNAGDQAARLPALDGILSNEGRAELEKILTPEQMARLDNLQGDLKRQSTLLSNKPSGSDTASLLKADKLKSDVASSLFSGAMGRIPVLGTMFKLLGGHLEQRGSGAIDNALGRAYTDVPYAAQVLEAGMASPETITEQIKNNLSASAKGSGIGSLPKDQLSAVLEKKKNEDAKQKELDRMFSK